MERVRVAVDCGGTSSKAVLLVDGSDRAVPVPVRPAPVRPVPVRPVPVRFESTATLSGYLEPARIADVMREIVAPIERRYVDDGLDGVPVVVVIAAAGFVDGLRDRSGRAVVTTGSRPTRARRSGSASTAFARFAIGVCSAAAQGDARAVRIVQTQSDELATTVARVERRADGVVGGIRWHAVHDGLDAVAALSRSELRWPASLGTHRPLVVRAIPDVD